MSDDDTPESPEPEPGGSTTAPAGDARAASAPTPVADAAPDVGRRRFFRLMASDAVNAAATVMGTVGALQRQSAEAAQTLLGLAPPVPAAEIVAAPGMAATPKPISGAFRTPFRWEGDRLILLDQRSFPQDVVEVTCRTGPEVAQALRDGVVEGAPAIGQVAAYGLALTALAAVDSRPYQRLAMIRGMANALANARSAVAPAIWSTSRLLARFESLDRLTDDGPGVGAALVEEAEAVATWYMDAHLRLVEVGLAALPDRSTALRALVHGQVGALASGQVGSALGLLQAARRPGVSVTAYVTEGRPNWPAHVSPRGSSPSRTSPTGSCPKRASDT